MAAPYLAETVRDLLAALEVAPSGCSSMPDLDDLRGIVDKVREGDVATLIVGPERRATLDRMQAFMAVLEGYAEHVMDAVGAQVLPDLPKLRGALDRRRRDRSGLLRIFEKLIGMDLKLRQYEQGKKFCDAVVERRRHRGAQPRLGRAPSRCRRSASSTIPRAGCAVPRAGSPPFSRAPDGGRRAERTFVLLQSRCLFPALRGDSASLV